MRHYDFHAAARVDHFIANSKETQKRILKFYRREAAVIYPPIDINPKSKILNPKQIQSTKFQKNKQYYLVVSRLAQPKNVDLAIQAANERKFPLKIAGVGPDEKRLKALAGPTVEFLGFVPDSDLPRLYECAKAFLALSGDEDFGMTPVEAQMYGTPVIAYRGGGYQESIEEGKTGIYVEALTAQELGRAIGKFETQHFSRESCISYATKFSKVRFKREIAAFVKNHGVVS